MIKSDPKIQGGRPFFGGTKPIIYIDTVVKFIEDHDAEEFYEKYFGLLSVEQVAFAIQTFKEQTDAKVAAILSYVKPGIFYLPYIPICYKTGPDTWHYELRPLPEKEPEIVRMECGTQVIPDNGISPNPRNCFGW